MPRLPTMRVIGSQFISTMLAGFFAAIGFVADIDIVGCLPWTLGRMTSVARRLVAGRELRTCVAPLGLLIEGRVGERPQRADEPSVRLDEGRRKDRPRRLVHERHELVGEAWHRAANANATDIGTATHAGHPSSFGDIALDDRTPAAEFDNALRRAVLGGKIARLVIAGAVATLMHGFLEQPLGPSSIVKRDHGSKPRELAQQVEERLHEVVRLNWASWDVDDRETSFGLPIPSEIVRDPHASCRVALHGVDAPICGARSSSDYAKRLGR